MILILNAGEGMEHYLIRATIIPGIVERIKDYYHMTEREALRAFYHSATGASLADDETGLYGQSELFLVGFFFVEGRNLWVKLEVECSAVGKAKGSIALRRSRRGI